MGVDVQLQTEDGRPIERLGDARGSMAKFLLMVDADATACLRFIDPYGDTTFNSLQLPVLETEVKTHLSNLDLARLRANREHRLAEAIRLGWQATVIEQLREGLGNAASDAEELQDVKSHLGQVVELIGRARRAGAHTYLRFIGD
jgi:hypothetical protein